MLDPAFATQPNHIEQRKNLVEQLKAIPRKQAVALLADADPQLACEALTELNPAFTQDILEILPDAQSQAIIQCATPQLARQWERNHAYAAGTIGRLMEPTYALYSPDITVAEAVEKMRAFVKVAFITYGYIIDAESRLIGLVTMRDLLLAERDARLGDVMLRNVFKLHPDMTTQAAMNQSLSRHFPVYPVCDEQGVLLGLVRGQAIFETEAFEVATQPGSMVGVVKEERISTPMRRSFLFRHPWLQLNLVTAFVAGSVVAIFQGTVDRLVVLAVFLPILAGQSGNTGLQALAVTLRGITLGEIRDGDSRKLIAKEAWLGTMNGTPIGLIAGAAMFILSHAQHSPHALMLGFVVFLAMVGACTISGISGAIVPLTLKRCGADPATASSIFLTTATDVVSMGMLLGLATILVR